MIQLTHQAQALLALAAFGAGFVDAIAGGGGIITLPALLFAGLPPHLALGTNKGQSVFGSFSALVRYTRAGLLDRKLAKLTFPLGLIGSPIGAQLVLWVSPSSLRGIVLVLLVGVAIFLALQGGPGKPREPVSRPMLVAGIVAFGLSIYDGFFGPGVGTFLIVAFVALLGRTLDRASADAKAVNFASNLAALTLFASRGVVLWSVALPMALAQAAGAWLGAHVTVKGGARVVRPVALLVTVGLVARLVRDLFGS